MKGLDIHYVASLVKMGAHPEHIKQILIKPNQDLWQSIVAEVFPRHEFEIIRASSIGLLLELYVLSGYLLYGKQDSAIADLIEKLIPVDQYVSNWSQLIKGDWTPVPTFWVSGNECEVRYFLVGLIPEHGLGIMIPSWAENMMDRACQNAIQTAATAASQMADVRQNHTYSCFPLTCPSLSIHFTGASLGLPIALGFLSLLKNHGRHRNIAATGAVRENGTVERIDHLDLKMKYATDQGVKAFLYPSANGIIDLKDIDGIPVSTLDEADMFCQLYDPTDKDNAKKLLVLFDMLKDPQTMVNNCDRVDCRWIEWASSHKKLDPIIHQIIASDELFTTFVNHIGKCMKNYEVDRGKLWSELISPTLLNDLKKSSPLATFKWASLNIKIADRYGKYQSDVDDWVAIAHDLMDVVRKQNIDEAANFYNRLFIYRHNQYRFDVQLPNDIHDTLQKLERLFQCQTECGMTSSKILGKLYGSIGQNYAFCRMVADAKTYFERSQNAFGSGMVPELKEDWLREFNYLTYAYLDAGNIELARHNLCAYLEIQDISEILKTFDKLTEFQHALIARFLNDWQDTNLRKTYLDMGSKHKNRLLKSKHPWQLWAYNMGRLAVSLDNRSEATDFFNKSIDISLKLGPTIQMMALLPLSGLWRLGRSPSPDIIENLQITAQTLNPDRFRILEENDINTVLNQVHETPEKWFPFNFR